MRSAQHQSRAPRRSAAQATPLQCCSGAARDQRFLCLADPVARFDGARPVRSLTFATAAARCGPPSQDTHRLRKTIAQAARPRRQPSSASSTWTARAVTAPTATTTSRSRPRCLSRELRRPVRVQWMREDEHGWDPKGPPQLLDLRATLGADGDNRGVGNRRDGAGERAEASQTSRCSPPSPPGLMMAERLFAGLLSLNADPPYADRQHAR